MVRAADLLHRVLDRAHEELHALVTRTVRSLPNTLAYF